MFFGDSVGEDLARKTVTRNRFKRAWRRIREERGSSCGLIGYGVDLNVARAAYWSARDKRTVREVLRERMF